MIKQNPFSDLLAKGFTILKRVQNQLMMFLEMSIVLEVIVSTERKVNHQKVMEQLRDPFRVEDSVEPSCLFTKFFLFYRSTQGRQKQTNYAFSLLKKLGTRQTVVHYYPFPINKIWREKSVCGQQSTREYWRCVLPNF